MRAFLTLLLVGILLAVAGVAVDEMSLAVLGVLAFLGAVVHAVLAARSTRHEHPDRERDQDGAAL